MDYKELFGDDIATKIDSICKEKGFNLIVDNKEKPDYIPKSRFDEVIGSKNELKTQVGELTSQLEILKKAAKGNEELTKQIDELQKKNGEWEGKYKTTLLDSAIKIKATAEKAKDPADLVKFLDTSKLEIDEQGNVKGLEDQIKTLKESKGYLFDNGNPNPSPNPAGGDNKTELQKLEDEYQNAIKASNMPLAIAIKNKIIAMHNKK